MSFEDPYLGFDDEEPSRWEAIAGKCFAIALAAAIVIAFAIKG
jgi:hypothetical protein